MSPKNESTREPGRHIKGAVPMPVLARARSYSDVIRLYMGVMFKELNNAKTLHPDDETARTTEAQENAIYRVYLLGVQDGMNGINAVPEGTRP